MFFLTSNIGGYKNIGDIKSSDLFFSDNDFLKNLKNGLKNNHKFVLIASDPLDYKTNDMYLNLTKNSLEFSALYFGIYSSCFILILQRFAIFIVLSIDLFEQSVITSW